MIGLLFLLVSVSATLDPLSIPKYENTVMVVPAMPQSKGTSSDLHYYEIGIRQFAQRLLPPSLNLLTRVWGYGSLEMPDTCDNGGSFCTPSLTIEAVPDVPVQIKWLNQLVDDANNFLPPLVPVDQTIHWANPAGPIDQCGIIQTPYAGPTPLSPHVHGAHTTEDSDGHPEAWFLPNAANLGDFTPYGSRYKEFQAQAANGSDWVPGSVVFNYPNDQRASTLWYHDHSLGLTRTNTYAGLAGFYVLRGNDSDVKGVLPGPAPQVGDSPGKEYFEMVLILQDRTFNEDGSLFYPDNRAYFEDIPEDTLAIPFAPSPACGGPSDVHGIWQPEFVGDTIMVNGRVWPRLEVHPVRYRFRILNGANTRLFILTLDQNMTFYIIGNDGGYLPNVVTAQQLILGPAERLDVEIDFSQVPFGSKIVMYNLGPDGGYEDGAFDPADPQTTGQVMRFDVVLPVMTDPSTPPLDLVLPQIEPIDYSSAPVRQLSLTGSDSVTVLVDFADNGTVFLDCSSVLQFETVLSSLGVYSGSPDTGGTAKPLRWSDPATETPKKDVVELWDLINLTEDAHPIHIHQVQFQVVYRKGFGEDPVPPYDYEQGFKDTIIAYPDVVTRVALKFDISGNFVWHCHILEHEDNEMMRPIVVSD